LPAPAALAGCIGGLDAWSYGAPDPSGPLEGPAVGSDGTYLYAAGGYDGDPLSGTYRYEPSTDTWTTLAGLPIAIRYGRGAYAPNVGKLYVFGGTDVGVLDTTYAYDIASDRWTTAAPMPGPRYFAGAAYDPGTQKIFVVGGFDTAFHELSQLWEYDPVSDTWSSLRAMPSPMAGSGVSILGRFLYVMGDWNSGTGSSLNYRYDIGANSWTTRAPLPTPAYAPASGVLGGEVYLTGGGNPFAPPGGPRSSFTSTYVYDPAADSWSSGPNLNLARSVTAGTTIGDRMVIVGGYTGTEDTDTVELASACTPPPAPPPPPPLRCRVPKVVGQRLTAAKTRLIRAHCRVGRVTKKRSRAAKRGRVLSQTPKPGKTLGRGGRVALKIGKGP